MAPSLWQLLIVLAIVVMVFGTKRLRGMGGDLGSAIRGFKDSMKSGEKEADDHVTQLTTEESEAAEGTTAHRDKAEATSEQNQKRG